MKPKLDCSANTDIRVSWHRGTFFAPFKAAFGQSVWQSTIPIRCFAQQSFKIEIRPNGRHVLYWNHSKIATLKDNASHLSRSGKLQLTSVHWCCMLLIIHILEGKTISFLAGEKSEVNFLSSFCVGQLNIGKRSGKNKVQYAIQFRDKTLWKST